jgi:hypothetical protein
MEEGVNPAEAGMTDQQTANRHNPLEQELQRLLSLLANPASMTTKNKETNHEIKGHIYIWPQGIFSGNGSGRRNLRRELADCREAGVGPAETRRTRTAAASL